MRVSRAPVQIERRLGCDLFLTCVGLASVPHCMCLECPNKSRRQQKTAYGLSQSLWSATNASSSSLAPGAPPLLFSAHISFVIDSLAAMTAS